MMGAPNDRSTTQEVAKSSPDTPKTDDSSKTDGKDELRESYKAALARKTAKNSHVEKHLDGHTVGGGNNDTHKRQFRRKSG